MTNPVRRATFATCSASFHRMATGAEHHRWSIQSPSMSRHTSGSREPHVRHGLQVRVWPNFQLAPTLIKYGCTQRCMPNLAETNLHLNPTSKAEVFNCQPRPEYPSAACNWKALSSFDAWDLDGLMVTRSRRMQAITGHSHSCQTSATHHKNQAKRTKILEVLLPSFACSSPRLF